MCLQNQDFMMQMNSTTSCAPLPTWKLWADIWILEWSAGGQSMRGYPGHHHLGPSPPLRDVGWCQPRIMPLHLVGDVGWSLWPIYAQPPPLLKGCVSIGGGGGRTQLGSCRGGVRETRRRKERNDDDVGDHSQSNMMAGQWQQVGANNH